MWKTGFSKFSFCVYVATDALQPDFNAEWISSINAEIGGHHPSTSKDSTDYICHIY